MSCEAMSCDEKLQQLARSPDAAIIFENRIGLEKESLRVCDDGTLAQTPHPQAWGSPLTHPYFTTDYSESMPEFITPPFKEVKRALQFLGDLHHFAYQQLPDEFLWATSMPCVVTGETSIPLARYGNSNAGQMKTVYRRGLGYRYGRWMQVIAGVHVNFSFSDAFWEALSIMEGNKGSMQDFISEHYFGLLRNLQRVGWLIPYLFGCSPAVCKSFVKSASAEFEDFDDVTYYQPWATSLRMGDIGYQNNKENELGFKANYDNLQKYIDSLEKAIRTTSPVYESVGVKKDGKYIQLNTNILQIENEYYSTVRPKQVPGRDERPTVALGKRGVEYVELRSLDINAFHPLGVEENQLNFVKLLMYWAVLQDSPAVSEIECSEIDENELLVAHQGRKPGLTLRRQGKEVSLKDWAQEILDAMKQIAQQLDRIESTSCYSHALNVMQQRVDDAENTPSAIMLNEMQQRGEGFHQLARRLSDQYHDYFNQMELHPVRKVFFNELAKESLNNQKNIEEADHISFEEYLSNYYK